MTKGRVIGFNVAPGRDTMAAQPTDGDRQVHSHVTERGPAGARRAGLPLMLVPLGALYCQAHEALFASIRGSILSSLVWATATLMPWALGAMVFEHATCPGELRPATLRRAAVIAIAAYLLSAVAALVLGGNGDRAFYSRLPLVAAAMLGALLYHRPATPSATVAGSVVPPGDDSPPIAPIDILLASAAGNYVELHAHGRRAVWRQTMHNAERILQSSGFVRVHRSYLVPRGRIEAIRTSRTRPVEVALQGGDTVPVSNRYAANLLT